MSELILVYSTTPDFETAKRIAHELVDLKLAACVSIVPGIHSVYRWENTVEEASEIALMIKTTKQHFDELCLVLVSLHPYDVPEVISVPIEDGLDSYLQWIRDETTLRLF